MQGKINGCWNYFWPPRVMVAPPIVVVRRNKFRDSKRLSKSSYSFEIHFREIMTGVILTTESHGWLSEFSKCANTSEMHLFVLIYHFLHIFPAHTKNNIKYTIIGFWTNIIQAIKVLCARILRSHHVSYVLWPKRAKPCQLLSFYNFDSSKTSPIVRRDI